MSCCFFNQLRSWFAGAVVLASMMQPHTAFAGPNSVEPIRSVSFETQLHSADIALQDGCGLIGQVVDDAGVGVASVEVELTKGRERWQTKSDADGWFQISGLAGGVYYFEGSGRKQTLRLWAPGTAPPMASKGILLSPSTDTVRGQRVVSPRTNQFFRFAKQQLAKPLVVGGIIATAVAIPVAIHNTNNGSPPATP